jgi:hypothetical protein
MQFLFEQRTEPYLNTVKGVAQKKNVYSAKSISTKRALPGLMEYAV